MEYRRSQSSYSEPFHVRPRSVGLTKDGCTSSGSIGAGVCAGDLGIFCGTQVNGQRTVRGSRDGEVQWRCMEEHGVFSSEVTTALFEPRRKQTKDFEVAVAQRPSLLREQRFIGAVYSSDSNVARVIVAAGNCVKFLRHKSASRVHLVNFDLVKQL
ncbi:hypothetical protein BT67DRAFT_433852 [Trichocladium antarcticum]|uniref:Uncharacterized protein n=1 Tax=Trichocladium antarcticum TaxID=1450529 RepID=A0AAN6UL67_9PEZI|nr:hypothetical protein BT67DRAFT_433852 [Trichocladium antarcticum]